MKLSEAIEILKLDVKGVVTDTVAYLQELQDLKKGGT